MSELMVDGLPVAVERKRIRNIYLRVKPPDGRVVLTAPRLYSDMAATAFVRERMPWVQKQLARYASYRPAAYVSGETVTLFGVPYRLQVAEAEKRASAFLDGDRLVLRVPLGSDAESRKRALDNFLRRALEEAIPPLAAECEATVGKHASEWRIRDMTSRWGTCNTATGAITLNLALARRAPQYLRYVMLHELTHLYEPSHNARFYRLMDGFCPGWKTLRKELKTAE